MVETAWPGDPQHAWSKVDDAGSNLWVPSPDDLPRWDSPQALNRAYVIVPVSWQRATLVMVALFLAVLAVIVVGPNFDWSSYGPVRRVLAVLLAVIVVGSLLTTIVQYVRMEVRWRRLRPETLERMATKLAGDRIPIWGLFVGRIRLGDRMSGPNDAPDDIQFMFDLRAPRETLQRQRAVATAWVEAVAEASSTNVPKELGAAFGRRSSVHCADVFGEQMRGVWMWRKGSILPREVLGLALTDPREAGQFTDEDVVFIRRTPRELRRRSRIAKP